MLHKDKKLRSTKASSFWTIKAFAAMMLLIMLALPAAAHPPAQVSLAYDSQNQSLNVTTTHAVSNPASHYVFKIDVLKNGVQVLTKEYTIQPTSSKFSYNYSLNASKGEVLKATAYCIIAGSRSAEITVEDIKLVVQQAGADIYSQLWYQDIGIGGVSEEDDAYGFSVAAGDFNNDGYDDLAIGVPFDGIGNKAYAGAVNVFYGFTGGFKRANSEVWYQDLGIGGISEEGDHFGYSLAAGDFNNDGYDDLAIGVDYEDVGGKENVGAVNVLHGSPGGLKKEDSKIWYQDLGIGSGLSEADQQAMFGASVAAGDFNNDGFDDLAIGVPHDDIGGKTFAGAVNVLFGSLVGLKKEDSEVWYQDLGIGGVSEAFDLFGDSVAAGDFNNDGYDDLAIGVPHEDVGGKENVGAVNVLHGSSRGLKIARSTIWYQDLGIGGSSEAGDRFGSSVAAGDFNNDGFDDLAIGVPYENISDKVNAGAVNVLYGSFVGLKKEDSKIWYQDLGIGGVSEAGDWFGWSVAAGDFNNDGFDDLAIGVPDEGIGDKCGAGAVNVLYGSSGGLKIADSKIWYQDLGIGGVSEFGDFFGYSVASGDFNKDGYDDLAIGVPTEAIGDKAYAGAVNVLYDM